MSAHPFHRAIYLTGPTASGKTAVAVELARRLDAEIVAMDSMTLYRGMDIGTAKPTREERGDVPHHVLDVLDAWECASVADFRGWASHAAAEILRRGRRVLICGGTPLYLKALLRGLFEGPPADMDLRLELEEEAERLGDSALHARLASLDGPTAARLHPNDRRRVIRALEVLRITGEPLSQLQSQHDRPAPLSVPVLALERPRDELNDRINRRVTFMLRAGLVDEVRRLESAPRPIHSVPAQAVGYREVLDHLSDPDEFPLDITEQRMQSRTRQFARRQATWFRGLVEVRPFPVSRDESPSDISSRLFRTLHKRGDLPG